MEDATCAHCGVIFRPDKTGRVFCSRACYRASGGRTTHSGGYMLVYRPDHPRASKSGQVMEHLVVMDEILGRYVTLDETVHHRNGDKTDNRPENLELWTTRHPKGKRVEDVVEFAVEMLARYAPERLAL
jgi:HNH endonuclease